MTHNKFDLTAPNPVAIAKNNTIRLDTYNDSAWDMAINVVTYPVKILPLFIQPETNQDFLRAEGTTNTNRHTEFYGIVVDRARTEDLQTIATVTGMYSTLSTSEVYLDLKRDLEKANVKSSPISVYVSGSGGSHILSISLDDLVSPVLSDGSTFKMSLTLNTSIDGSKKHTISIAPVDDSGRILFGIDSTLSFSAKHTRTIGERSVAFSTVINKLLAEWNDVIAPMIVMLDGQKYSSSMAMSLLEEIMTEADMPVKHIKGVTEAVDSIYTHRSALSILNGIGEYLEDAVYNRPERMLQFRQNINKHAMKIIKKSIKA
ncbi:MAG: hypothetical protein PF440_03720 [Thiomicrorhabdus sp.]|jgi:hypothetical protein|nr:hypothetical protein [Thiomicrorhabdus sp.]